MDSYIFSNHSADIFFELSKKSWFQKVTKSLFFSIIKASIIFFELFTIFHNAFIKIQAVKWQSINNIRKLLVALTQ